VVLQSAHSTLPEVDEAKFIATMPIVVLDRKWKRQGNRAVVYVLQWSAGSNEEATWELYSDIEKRFPEFNWAS